MTGARAALIHWTVFVRFTDFREGLLGRRAPIERGLLPFDESEIERYVELGSAAVGGELQLETDEGAVLIRHVRDVAVSFAGVADYGPPLQQALPAELAHVLRAPFANRGPLHCRELLLTQATPVRLIATVARDSTGDGPYRSELHRAWVVQPEKERPILEDLTALSARF